jgi:hypothetical protein
LLPPATLPPGWSRLFIFATPLPRHAFTLHRFSPAPVLRRWRICRPPAAARQDATRCYTDTRLFFAIRHVILLPKR